MKHLKRFDEGFFDLFKKKWSEDDKIILEFIKRLERVKDVSPYEIELSTAGTEPGETYETTYKVIFDDVTVKIRKVECDRKYRTGWHEETQKRWVKDGAVRKNNHIFYGCTIYMIDGKEGLTPSLKVTEQFFELVKKVNEQSKYKSKINKIKGEMNPAADLLDPEIYPETGIKEGINLREVKFTGKRNPRLEIVVTKTPDGRITNIENETGIRFPFSVGQILNRTAEVWACNNNFLMDGKDTCPEKKIFGVRASDVPQGHEWRHIFPHKF